MKRFVSSGTIIIAMCLLAACSPAATALPQATNTLPEASATATAPEANLEPIPFSLSERDLYHVGTRKFDFNDANRDDRYVDITVWYPAVHPTDATDSKLTFEAESDASDAPYPLILSSAKSGSIFAPHLASHGFVGSGRYD